MSLKDKFIRHVKKSGFTNEQIAQLPARIKSLGNNVGEIPTGGWADGKYFLVGRKGMIANRQQRIRHELGHVLDDIVNPGLFQKGAKSSFGFKNFYKAERVAYISQYGFDPIPSTAYNAVFQSHPLTSRIVLVSAMTAETIWLYDQF